MKTLTLAGAALTLAFAVGCGGESSTPTTSSAPAVTIPSISTSNTLISVGQSVVFAAIGGGTIRWGGDAPSVATVDRTTGRGTGVSTGRVTIWAENDGGRTTRLLRGLPSYAGVWAGNYTTQSCQQNGAFSVLDFCRNNYTAGQNLSMAMGMSQTEDRVSGQLALGSLQGSLTSSTVAEDGEVRLTGSVAPSGTVRLSLDNIRLESPTAGVIRGQFELVWSSTELSGTARVGARIENLTRTSGGPIVAFQAPSSTGPMTMEEMLKALGR